MESTRNVLSVITKNISDSYRAFSNLCLGQVLLIEGGDAGEEIDEILEDIEYETQVDSSVIRTIYNAWIQKYNSKGYCSISRSKRQC